MNNTNALPSGGGAGVAVEVPPSSGGGTATSNTAVPTISGTAEEGDVLTAGNGTWSGTTPITYTYQWQDNGVNINGATSSTYTPTDSNVGDTIDVVVTATNSAGNTNAMSSNTNSVTDAPAPTNTAGPTVSGTAQVGQTLTTTNGTWSGLGQITYAYQWQDCDSSGENCTNINGATSSTYTVAAGDLGHTIKSVVTATN